MYRGCIIRIMICVKGGEVDKLQVELRPGGCIARSMISVKGGTSGSGPPPFFCSSVCVQYNILNAN